MNDLEALHVKYPWLSNSPKRPSDYLKPDYYDRLLREYSFNGRTDLDLVKEYMDCQYGTSPGDLLELGCGSGRTSSVLVSYLNGQNRLDLVDLSAPMAAHCRRRFYERSDVRVVVSDSGIGFD